MAQITCALQIEKMPAHKEPFRTLHYNSCMSIFYENEVSVAIYVVHYGL